MAGTKISAMPNTATAANSDLFVLASGGANKNIQFQQLFAQLDIPSGDVAFTNTDGALSVEASVADGQGAVAISFDTSGELTAGKLVNVKNDGVSKFSVGYQGLAIATEIQIHNGGDDYISLSPTAIVAEPDATEIRIHPSIGDGFTPFLLRTRAAHTSGNILELNSGETNVLAVTFAGRIIAPSAPPANASATGVAGSITWDASFVYVCTATNTWKRASIATW